jgi:hypothetical protein
LSRVAYRHIAISSFPRGCNRDIYDCLLEWHFTILLAPILPLPVSWGQNFRKRPVLLQCWHIHCQLSRLSFGRGLVPPQ